MHGNRWIVAFALLLAAATSARAGVEEIVVKVEGLACPFCAFNIEKRVKTLDGVNPKARVQVSVDTGEARVPWNGKPFDLRTFRKSIVEAGFTPGQVTVLASGRVLLDGSAKKLRLVDEASKLDAGLVTAQRADRKQSLASLRAAASRRKQALRARVEGVAKAVKTAAGETWTLVLRRWEPREFGADVVVRVDKFACEQCSTRTMRVLERLDGVIHAHADHEKDLVRVWLAGASPDLAPLRKAIENAGFKVKTIHIRAHEASR